MKESPESFSERSFSELYGLARAGDTEALALIIQRVQEPLCRHIESGMGTRLLRFCDVDDVAQETLAAVHRRIRGYPSKLTFNRFLSYVKRMASNKLVDLSRKRDPDRVGSALHSSQLHVTKPTMGTATGRDLAAHVMDRVGGPQEIEMLSLDLGGESLREIARRFDMTEDAARMKLKRLKGTLRRFMPDVGER